MINVAMHLCKNQQACCHLHALHWRAESQHTLHRNVGIMPLPLIMRSPRGAKESGMLASSTTAADAWMHMGKPVLSMREATLTVSPAPFTHAHRS